MKRIWILMVMCIGIRSANGYETINPFPVPEGMELRVQFWINVFTKYSVDQQIIHDGDRPERIYRIVDFQALFPNGEVTPDQKEKVIQEEKEKVVALLKKFASGKMSEEELSAEELRIYRLFGKSPQKKELHRAISDVRVQRGMKEAFQEGLVRSGRYISTIREIFRKEGLPEELVYLPHVESSFHPLARSRSGAVGIWQFTRATGRRYLKIGKGVDERRDPFLSSKAAAQFLKSNYEILGHWPLAVLAYNYGLAGIQRAVARIGTTDIHQIIQSYESRRFGFASKNFYAEFLAAVCVAQEPQKYFEDAFLEPSLEFQTVTIQHPQKIGKIAEAVGIAKEEIRKLNPALRPEIFREEEPVPSGYELRIPAGAVTYADAESLRINGSQKIDEKAVPTPEGKLLDDAQKLETVQTVFTQSQNEVSELSTKDDSLHLLQAVVDKNAVVRWQEAALQVQNQILVVYPEETLGHYATWLEIPTQALRNLNALKYGQKIRVGQKLKISFEKVPAEVFLQRRLAFHRAIHEDFFQNYWIEDSTVHTIEEGESFWTVAKYQYGVPLWLFMAYNEDKDPNRVSPGEKVRIPILRKVNLGGVN